jgi:hypothetical protein
MTTPLHATPRQFNDQIMCSHCGKCWDVNDPDPPPCEPLKKDPSNIKQFRFKVKPGTNDKIQQIRKATKSSPTKVMNLALQIGLDSIIAELNKAP